jgi:hypothetical protein
MKTVCMLHRVGFFDRCRVICLTCEVACPPFSAGPATEGRSTVYKLRRGNLETENVSYVVCEILGPCFADLIVSKFVSAGGGRAPPPAKTKSETLFITLLEMATCPTMALNWRMCAAWYRQKWRPCTRVVQCEHVVQSGPRVRFSSS